MLLTLYLLTDFNEGLQLKNVSFAYRRKRGIEDGINLNRVPKAKRSPWLVRLAVESPFMDLFPRFIEPQSGWVLVDGKNIQISKN